MCINAAALLFMRYFGEARLLRASASKSHNKYSLKILAARDMNGSADAHILLRNGNDRSYFQAMLHRG